MSVQDILTLGRVAVVGEDSSGGGPEVHASKTGSPAN